MYTLKQFIEKFDEELSMTTTAVPGAGDDSSTVVMRKKFDRKNKRKDQMTLLKRLVNSRK